MEQPALVAGQVWSYVTRPQDVRSTLTIAKLEHLDGQSVAHVAVADVIDPHGKEMELSHLPIAADSVRASVITLISEGQEMSEDTKEGYETWREAYEAREGGWFKLPVSEVVEAVFHAMTNAYDKAE